MKTNPAAALLAALQAGPVPDVVPPGWFTMEEIADMMGKQRSWAAKKVNNLPNVQVKIFKVTRGNCLRHVPHYRKNSDKQNPIRNKTATNRQPWRSDSV